MDLERKVWRVRVQKPRRGGISSKGRSPLGMEANDFLQALKGRNGFGTESLESEGTKAPKGRNK